VSAGSPPTAMGHPSSGPCLDVSGRIQFIITGLIRLITQFRTGSKNPKPFLPQSELKTDCTEGVELCKSFLFRTGIYNFLGFAEVRQPRVRDEVESKSYACMRPRRRRLLKRILSVPNCGSDRIVSITLHIFHPICLYLCILVSQADITGHLFAARFFSLSFHVSHATEKHDVFDQNPFDSLFDICMRRSAYK
jgi:hypothetical protein